MPQRPTDDTMAPLGITCLVFLSVIHIEAIPTGTFMLGAFLAWLFVLPLTMALNNHVLGHKRRCPQDCVAANCTTFAVSSICASMLLVTYRPSLSLSLGCLLRVVGKMALGIAAAYYGEVLSFDFGGRLHRVLKSKGVESKVLEELGRRVKDYKGGEREGSRHAGAVGKGSESFETWRARMGAEWGSKEAMHFRRA